MVYQGNADTGQNNRGHDYPNLSHPGNATDNAYEGQGDRGEKISIQQAFEPAFMQIHYFQGKFKDQYA